MGEKKVRARLETDLMATGRREVEGQPPDEPRRWRKGELVGDIDDLSRGLRCDFSTSSQIFICTV